MKKQNNILFFLLGIFSFYSLKVSSQSIEDSLFLFIHKTSDSLITARLPNVIEYQYKIDFTINSMGELKGIEIFSKNKKITKLKKNFKKSLMLYNYSEIYKYLSNIDVFKKNNLITFQIVKRREGK